MSDGKSELAELLPCPLCGSPDLHVGSCFVDPAVQGEREAAVRCAQCGCRATMLAWNTRSSASAASPEREEKPIAWLVELRDDLKEAVFFDLQAKWAADRAKVTPLYATPPSQPAMKAVEDWQPIETAPKDGTKILAHWMAVVADGASDTDVTCWIAGEWIATDDVETKYSPPDYWMHLPAPPALTK